MPARHLVPDRARLMHDRARLMLDRALLEAQSGTRSLFGTIPHNENLDESQKLELILRRVNFELVSF
jgi:hypothetical protein